MALTEVTHWDWDEASFIRAWEAGIFGDQRVELVDGEVLRVVIGPWHGQVTMNLGHFLRAGGWRVTSSTLPAGGSLPDPDVFVFRRDATPISALGERRSVLRWNPSDIGLVVEVAETSWSLDTTVKAELYGRTGYPTYWVVHRAGIEVFSDPYEAGYRQQRHVDADGVVEVPYAPGTTIRVADLLDVDAD